MTEIKRIDRRKLIASGAAAIAMPALLNANSASAAPNRSRSSSWLFCSPPGLLRR